MGFVRKMTGADKQAEAIKQNAAAQADATRQAATQAQQQLMLSARQAAEQQALASARMVAENKAADSVSQPLAIADVQLDTTSPMAASVRRRKRVSFGTGANATGVSI